MPGIGRILWQLRLYSSLVINRIDRQILDRKMPFAAHQERMRWSIRSFNGLILEGAPVKFFKAFLARQKIIHVRKDGLVSAGAPQRNVQWNRQATGQNEHATRQGHDATAGGTSGVERLLNGVGAINLALGKHGGCILKIGRLGRGCAEFYRVEAS